MMWRIAFVVLTVWFIAFSDAWAKTYELGFTGKIYDYKNFEHIVEAAREAERGDVLEIHMNSTGGYVHVMELVLWEVRKSQAVAHIVIDDGDVAYSAAALFVTAMRSDTKFSIANGADLMFHAIKINHRDMDRYWTISIFNRMAHGPYAYRDILTLVEMDAILTYDEDIYMTGKEFNKRLR